MQVARRPRQESLERPISAPGPSIRESSTSESASHSESLLSPTLHTPSSPSAIERGSLLESGVTSFTHRFSDLLHLLESTSSSDESSFSDSQPQPQPQLQQPIATDPSSSSLIPETQPGMLPVVPQPQPHRPPPPSSSSDPVLSHITTSIEPLLEQTLHFCDEFDICTESLEEHLKSRQNDFSVQTLIQFDQMTLSPGITMERLREIYLRKKSESETENEYDRNVKKSQILMDLSRPRHELDALRLRELKLRYEVRKANVQGQNLEVCLETISSRWDRYEFQVAPAMRQRINQLEQRMGILKSKMDRCVRERDELREVKAQWLPIHEKLLKQRDRVQDLLQTDPADRKRSIREAIQRANAEKARLASVKQRRINQIAALEEQILDYEENESEVKLAQIEAVQTKVAYEKRDVTRLEHNIFRLHEAILLQQQESEKIWDQRCAREEKYLSGVREYQQSVREIEQTIHETLQARVASEIERDHSHAELLVIRRQKRRDDGFVQENRISVKSRHSLQMDRRFHLSQRLEATKSKIRALTKRLCSRKELISGLREDIETLERVGRGLLPIVEERKCALQREILKKSKFDTSVEESAGWGDVLTELEGMSQSLREHYSAGVD